MGFGASKLEKGFGDDFPEGEHYFGFENYGNTCYCNSVLQALYYCVPFREEVIRYYHTMFRDQMQNSEDEPLFASLCELFYQIDSQKKRTGVIGPRKFVHKLREENELFRGFMHQDAHEFLNYTLNEIAEFLQKVQKKSSRDLKIEQETKPNSGGSTFVHKIFEGILTNETRCLTCETVTSREESFLDLSLDIEQNTSLLSCLRQFSATETLCGEEKFYCDSCLSKQEAQKRIRIKKLPHTLVLHLKRFKFVEQLQRHKKLMYRVVFPFELRLPHTVATKDAAEAERMYDLFAVVTHIGSGPNHGHYVTIVKSHGRWLLFDDDNIELIEDENELRISYGCTNEMLSQPHRTDCGYLLFYQARPKEESVVMHHMDGLSNESPHVPDTLPNSSMKDV